jgi:NDP-sugar pyrophosphorylase family protein
MGRNQKITSAMILAAGFGTRMKEMSKDTPKALLSLDHLTPLDLSIQKLHKAGIQKIIINLHYLGAMIKTHLAKKNYHDLEIIFSEEREILGTGGGIANAEQYFKEETILVVNSDILSDFSFKDLMDDHYQKNPLASMAVWPSRNSREYALLLFDKKELLIDILPKGSEIDSPNLTGIFMGYHILTPQARRYLKPKFSSVIEDFYRPALRKRMKITVYPYHGTWIDLGSREHYFDILERLKNGELNIQQLI